MRALWLAEGGSFVPPGAGDFNLPPIFLGITKPMLLVVLCSVLFGARGGVAALIGGLVAFASSMATWWLMRKTAALNPMMVMTGALGGFFGKMIILLLVLMVFREITWLHAESLAYTMLAVVVVWAAMDTVAFRRTKLPTLIVNTDDQ